MFLIGRSQQQEDLHAVKALDEPEFMTVTPHDYQLKAAAQADFSCRSRFKGILIGDGMGVGKTLSAILAMYMVKDEPGFSLVVAPKTLCRQWVDYIEGAFEEVRHPSSMLQLR